MDPPTCFLAAVPLIVREPTEPCITRQAIGSKKCTVNPILPVGCPTGSCIIRSALCHFDTWKCIRRVTSTHSHRTKECLHCCGAAHVQRALDEKAPLEKLRPDVPMHFPTYFVHHHAPTGLTILVGRNAVAFQVSSDVVSEPSERIAFPRLDCGPHPSAPR